MDLSFGAISGNNALASSGVYPTAPLSLRAILQKDAVKIGIYFAVVIVLGAALAPLLFNLGKAVAGFRIVDPHSDGVGGYLYKVLATSDFNRYFNRAIQIAALVCLWPLLRSLKLRRGELGLERNPARFTHLGIGFSVAAVFLIAMGWAYVARDYFRADVTLHAGKAASIVTSALAAGAVEEIFFRGVLLGIVLRTAKPFSALLFVSAFFSLVHFLKPPVGLEVTNPQWGTGFWMVGQIFAQFGNPIFIAAEFTTLFAVGWILGMARLRTRSLWLSFGLHAGWIFSLKLYTDLTKLTPKLRRGEFLPWVGTDLKVGVVPLVVVVLTGVVVFFLIRKKPDKT
jgi:membrane protease YdiL (CAAX protease family)